MFGVVIRDEYQIKNKGLQHCSEPGHTHISSDQYNAHIPEEDLRINTYKKAWTVSFLFLTLVKQLEHSGNNIRIF